MTANIVKISEPFSEADLEYLEFLPEELKSIESELYPNLESISFEDVAEEMEAYLECRSKNEGWDFRQDKSKAIPSQIDLEANSSVKIFDKVSSIDILALKKYGRKFSVHFDASHPLRGRGSKKPHFEVNVLFDSQSLTSLAKKFSQTFSKFKFPLIDTKNQIKFEVGKFSQDVISKSLKRQQINNAIRRLHHNEIPGMILNVY
jgi:hypothetical protein